MGANPCRYCTAPKRHLGCHDRCPDYISWKEEKYELQAYARRQSRAYAELSMHYIEQREKYYKSNKRW